MICVGRIVGVYRMIGTMGVRFVAARVVMPMVMMLVGTMRVFVAVVALTMMHIIRRARINRGWWRCACGRCRSWGGAT